MLVRILCRSDLSVLDFKSLPSHVMWIDSIVHSESETDSITDDSSLVDESQSEFLQV